MQASNMPLAFVETVSHTESQGAQLDAADFPALPKDPEWELINTGDADHDLDVVPTTKERQTTSSDEDDQDDNDDGWIEYAPRPVPLSYVQIASKVTAPGPSPRQLMPKRNSKNKQMQNSPSPLLNEEEAATDELMYLAKDKGSQRLHDQTVRKTRDLKMITESRYHLTDGRERFVNSDILILPGNVKRRNHELMKSWKWFSKVGKRDSGRGERKKKASGAIPDYAV
ncbi:hypothetical protein INT44_003960 [Umbelopsis vinacea]|uniref:Uncharacterized protein n=1 Tax=Umbelopsis vinacea TaxID=44442 RepID=A0A8H7QCE0_9FUNG|nr:hypothetical protein INT44_003960 [Umbelopsis vinacea]